MKKVVFVHHSVGRQLMHAANLRKKLKDDNIELTDVDYNRYGAHSFDGSRVKAPLVPNDNTDIDVYSRLLASRKGSAFVHWLAEFDLVVLKSCFPNSNLVSDEALEEQKRQVEGIIINSAKLFKKIIWVTPPPLTKGITSRESAERAETIARWTCEHRWSANVRVFDLHSVLAEDSGQQRGILKRSYRRFPFDSHPNRKGALRAGTQLLDVIREFSSAS